MSKEVKKIKEQGVRKYKAYIEFNTDRVISSREQQIMLDLIAELLANPKDFKIIGKQDGIEIKKEIPATYKTIVINKEITYHAVPNRDDIPTKEEVVVE